MDLARINLKATVGRGTIRKKIIAPMLCVDAVTHLLVALWSS